MSRVGAVTLSGKLAHGEFPTSGVDEGAGLSCGAARTNAPWAGARRWKTRERNRPIVAAAYCLTRAETRVLASLLAGRTLAETADALGIAPTTAKTHLDNIFAKTGVTRQAELMRRATAVLPPARLQA
jgi:DNA-binding CsgD family transcriptional regulator